MELLEEKQKQFLGEGREQECSERLDRESKRVVLWEVQVEDSNLEFFSLEAASSEEILSVLFLLSGSPFPKHFWFSKDFDWEFPIFLLLFAVLPGKKLTPLG